MPYHSTDDFGDSFYKRLESRENYRSMQKREEYLKTQLVEPEDEEVELMPSIIGNTIREPEINAFAFAESLDQQEAAQTPVTQTIEPTQEDAGVLLEAYDKFPDWMQTLTAPLFHQLQVDSSLENPVTKGLITGVEDTFNGITGLLADVANYGHDVFGGEQIEPWQIPDLIKENPDSLAEPVVAAITQFMGVFGALGGLKAGATIWKMGNAEFGALATMDPTGENLATLLSSADIGGELTAYLAQPAGEDADALERLTSRIKTMAVEIPLAFVGPALVGGFRWAKENGYTEVLKDMMQNSDPDMVAKVLNKYGVDLPKKDVFAGNSAKYPPRGKAEMEQAYEGKTAFNTTVGFEDDVWKKTGWNKTPDGRSYFEIDDSLAYIKNEFELDDFVKAEQKLLKEADGSYFPGSGVRLAENSLENTLDHPELFRQYPVLKDYRVEWLDGIESKGFVVNLQGQGGSFNPMTKTITVHIDPAKGVTRDAMDTLLHEIQHGVQSLESWMNGGSTSENFIRSLRWRLYDDQKAFATDKAKYDRQLIQLSYASKLDDVKYWDKMAGKESITGQARHIYGTSLWYKHSDEIRREIGIPPKRHKKAEHNEFLKDVVIFFKRKAQDEVNSAYNRSPGLAADVSKMTQKDKVGAIRRLMDKNIDNVDEFRRLKRGIDEMASPVDRKDAVRITDREWQKERGDLYKRIQGEWQARNASKRYLMSKDKRREVSPRATGDVDRQSLIYTKNPDKMYGEVSSEVSGQEANVSFIKRKKDGTYDAYAYPKTWGEDAVYQKKGITEAELRADFGDEYIDDFFKSKDSRAIDEGATKQGKVVLSASVAGGAGASQAQDDSNPSDADYKRWKKQDGFKGSLKEYKKYFESNSSEPNNNDITDFIKGYEGYKGAGYYATESEEAEGIVSVGYGSTRRVKFGEKVTKKQAEKWFKEDIKKATTAVGRLVKIELNNNQRNALISLVYTVGPGNLKKSKALKALNSGDMKTFVKEAFDPKVGFVKDKSGGTILKGLVKRRAAEKKLFLKGAK